MYPYFYGFSCNTLMVSPWMVILYIWVFHSLTTYHAVLILQLSAPLELWTWNMFWSRLQWFKSYYLYDILFHMFAPCFLHTILQLGLFILSLSYERCGEMKGVLILLESISSISLYVSGVCFPFMVVDCASFFCQFNLRVFLFLAYPASLLIQPGFLFLLLMLIQGWSM